MEEARGKCMAVKLEERSARKEVETRKETRGKEKGNSQDTRGKRR
jgi:hypothetical protein